MRGGLPTSSGRGSTGTVGSAAGWLGLALLMAAPAAAQMLRADRQPGAAPTAATAQETDADLEALAKGAFDLLNEARNEAGLGSLAFDPSLARLARHHSQEQARRGHVTHHSYDFGLSTERRVRISFPRLGHFAENVARGGSVARVDAALLASPGHRRNRLDPSFTHVGIGLARRGAYVLYLTELFAAAPDGAALEEPVAWYFNARPGAYEPRPGVDFQTDAETIRIGAPDSGDPEHWTDAGIDAYMRGDLAGAEASFEKALELRPDYTFASYNLARVLNRSGRPAESIVILDALLAASPADLDARLTRGNARMLLQDFAGAAEDFRTVLQQRPRDAEAWYDLGLALEYLGRARDAATAYRQAIHVDPGLVPAHAGLARVGGGSGRRQP